MVVFTPHCCLQAVSLKMAPSVGTEGKMYIPRTDGRREASICQGLAHSSTCGHVFLMTSSNKYVEKHLHTGEERKVKAGGICTYNKYKWGSTSEEKPDMPRKQSVIYPVLSGGSRLSGVSLLLTQGLMWSQEKHVGGFLTSFSLFEIAVKPEMRLLYPFWVWILREETEFSSASNRFMIFLRHLIALGKADLSCRRWQKDWSVSSVYPCYPVL